MALSNGSLEVLAYASHRSGLLGSALHRPLRVSRVTSGGMTFSPAPHAPVPPAPGAPAPRRSPLPWILVAVLAVVALVLGVLLVVGGGGSDDSEQQGFATPEEAIEFSTEKIADGDAAAALTAWAGDAQAENLDLVGTLERFRALSPVDTSSVPSDDEFFVELGRTTRAGTAADQYRRMAFSLLLPEVRYDTTTRLDGGDLSAQDVADGLDSERLSSLKAQQVDLVVGLSSTTRPSPRRPPSSAPTSAASTSSSTSGTATRTSAASVSCATATTGRSTPSPRRSPTPRTARSSRPPPTSTTPWSRDSRGADGRSADRGVPQSSKGQSHSASSSPSTRSAILPK